MTGRDFWRSAGLHLTEPDAQGWLRVTPDYLRAYYLRPEIHPIEESCDAERRLFEALMEDPFRNVSEAELEAMADPDARENYRAVLRFREHLTESGTVEGAYLSLFTSGQVNVPPLFLDQMAHLTLRHILRDCDDPFRLRAAEIFFRDQNVNVDEGRVMLADQEIVEMRAQSGAPGQLVLAELSRGGQVEMDVLGEQNQDQYWERSEQFDFVVDFRFGQPAIDAFARVVEAWIRHFLKVEVRVQPRTAIQNEDWRWHIGLDTQATALLNALYRGETLEPDAEARIIALFDMRIPDETVVLEQARGQPIHLAMAMTPDKRLKMKPQNLLFNLPLISKN
ncbi:DUF6352 family protein [Dichotomicrobium thermohalophilum]|uniref:Uncharacterized protein n=1 Tax=Dichotomicrobium thermohalophilum TaxID=933063 RepID=A0A397PIS9_9HYPH|nr:DUF6352 family protein [Dichotomicrobium thermohalophilum]RIA47185.1 hypothetical protein BXY53_2567 [Dichotomicrobium thermohalophilum]